MTEKKEKIGLYFGSFNPIHVGHLILASYIVQNSDLKKIWFVVSPQNPLKKQSSLADNNTRYHLVQLAVEDNPLFEVSNVEFSLPLPSYTINTLNFLSNKYPNKEFAILMGEDNLVTIDKWKDYQLILQNYPIYVYPRKEEEKTTIKTSFKDYNINVVDAPLINISASYIRSLIRQGKSIQYFVTDKVYKEIEKSNLYRQ